MTTSNDATTTDAATTTATTADTTPTTDVTSVDTSTQYIGLKDADGSRSVVELCELERSSGYSGMTDAEIKKLMSYHIAIAQQNAETSAIVAAHEDAIAARLTKMEETLASNKAVLDKIINATFTPATVTGNEVK
jgi:hypothetical protein